MTTITGPADDVRHLFRTHIEVQSHAQTIIDSDADDLHGLIVRHAEGVMRQAHLKVVAQRALDLMDDLGDVEGVEQFLTLADRKVGNFARYPLRSTDPIATIDSQYEAAAWSMLAHDVRRTVNG